MIKTEFDVALNVARLSPMDADFWRKALYEIRNELACKHRTGVEGFVGAYVSPSGSGDAPEFFLFARTLDLSNEGDATKYHDVERLLGRLIRKHCRG